MADQKAKPGLTVDHLQCGHLERILWLPEELELRYDLLIHKGAPC